MGLLSDQVGDLEGLKNFNLAVKDGKKMSFNTLITFVDLQDFFTSK